MVAQQRAVGLRHEERQRGARAHVRLVVPAVVQHVRDHAEEQRGVGAGFEGDPLVALRGGRAVMRVDGDGVHARILRVEEGFGLREARLDEVDAHEQQGLAIHPVGHAVERAHRAQGAGALGAAVDGSQAVGVAHVDAADGVHGGAQQLAQLGRHLRLHGDAGEHALLAVGVPALPHFLGEVGRRLVPGDGDELVGAALAHALERRLDALGAVDVLDLGEALEADGLQSLFGFVVRLNQAQAAVAHGALQHAMPAAVSLVIGVGDVLLRLRVRLGRCEPIVCREHSCSSRNAQRAGCGARGPEKAAAGQRRVWPVRT